MFKRIIVPTDGSETAAVGVRYAVALAKRYEAQITGVHVVDVKLLEGPFLQDLSASLGTAPYVNYQGNIAMILDERGQAALEEVKRACAEADVPCTTSLITGIVPRAIVEEAGLADLIVMGRGGEHIQWLEGVLGSTTEAVVRRAKQPVLVTSTDIGTHRSFLMAYDGTPHAKQALKSAVEIATDWSMSFRVLSVAPQSAKYLDEAREYLQAHSVEVEYERREGDPGECIVACARDMSADLIVMGAYGHSKVREFVVGSTTSYALNHAPCPVFLHR